MKARTVVLTLAFCLAGFVACFAVDGNVGTWKLNEAKSKIPAGAPRITSIVYTTEGDQYKCVIDETDASGNPIHNEWIGQFDGKEYAVNGDPSADMRAIQRVDDHHYKGTNSKGGKTMLTTTVVLSPDGKTRTLTVQPADGKSPATYVFDRQ